MYEHLHAMSPGNGVFTNWLRLIRCFSTPGRQPWSWRSRAQVLGGWSHSSNHRSCWRKACYRWSVAVLGLHKCVLNLPLRGPCGCEMGAPVGPVCSGGSVLRR